MKRSISRIEEKNRWNTMPANTFISLLYVPTTYYGKVWKIIITINTLQTTQNIL